MPSAFSCSSDLYLRIDYPRHALAVRPAQPGYEGPQHSRCCGPGGAVHLASNTSSSARAWRTCLFPTTIAAIPTTTCRSAITGMDQIDPADLPAQNGALVYFRTPDGHATMCAIACPKSRWNAAKREWDGCARSPVTTCAGASTRLWCGRSSMPSTTTTSSNTPSTRTAASTSGLARPAITFPAVHPSPTFTTDSGG